MSESWHYEHGTAVAASAARIFAALTEADQLERWFAERARVDARVGGEYRFWGRHTVGTPSESEASGKIVALEPNSLLSYDWVMCGVPSQVSIGLAPDETDKGPGTRVTIRQELSGEPDLPRPRELVEDWWRFTLGNLTAHTVGHGEVLRPDFTSKSPEIRLSMKVEAPPDAVFRALTEPDALREWMGAPAPVVELRPGGRFELGWKYEVDGKEVTGGPTKVLEVVPGEKLVVNWPDWRGDASVPMQTITWQLAPEGGGTRVTLVHAGFTRTVDFSDYPFGWGHFMGRMKAVAERGA